MPHQTSLDEALRRRGLDVIEYRGWERRGSPAFHPRGVVCHHTGPGSTVGLVRLCLNGRRDLPGPLAQVVLDPDGTCHLIAAGRANHAGRGGWRGLAGNSSVFGIEAVHSGNPHAPWPERQLDAYLRCAAAMLEVAGADAGMCCGHKEWAPGRKPDPVNLDMGAFRARVAELLRPAPAPEGPGAPQRLAEVEGVRVAYYYVPIPSLDAQGRGWVDLPAPIERVIGLVGHGSSPPDDGYWPPVVVTSQPRGDVTRVTLAGHPNQATGVHAWVLET